MFSVRLLLLLAVTVFAVSGDSHDVCTCKECTCGSSGAPVVNTPPVSSGCKCVIPKMFPMDNGTYDNAWWIKKTKSIVAALPTGSGADQFIISFDKVENNGCLGTVGSSFAGDLAVHGLKNHEFNVVMVTIADKVITSSYNFDDKTTRVKFECNKDGQWTYGGTPIKLAGSINTYVPVK